MAEAERAWMVLPFRGDLVESRVAEVLQGALFAGRVELLEELLAGHAFASDELGADAAARAKRLTEQVMTGGIDYVGEGPYPAHWRMDAARGVFHYAGNSPWCFDAYRLLLDLAVVDPPPPGWPARFPEPDRGSFDAGGSLWDFFGDLSNAGPEFDASMGKLFDSLPVWLSPPESSFTGFLSERDARGLGALIDALGEGRLQRSFYLREFRAYLARAVGAGVGLTAAAVPEGQRWQEEQPRRVAEHW